MQRELIRTLVKRVEINQDDINVVFRVDGTLPTPDPTSPGQNSFWQDCGRVGERASGPLPSPFALLFGKATMAPADASAAPRREPVRPPAPARRRSDLPSRRIGPSAAGDAVLPACHAGRCRWAVSCKGR